MNVEGEYHAAIRTRLVGEEGLAYWCAECSAETMGLVYHSREGVSREEIEAALGDVPHARKWESHRRLRVIEGGRSTRVGAD